MNACPQRKSSYTGSGPTQVLASQSIDPAKLSKVLDQRFGQKMYRVEMRHNKFSISARGHLSQEEINQCVY
ncbi:hypothetical protein CDEST_03801 [Colletotrichum destructivum]|uniref:Uncharacterized protein n=1 Tax=Colletotrichum destructivum TaxID=34406 RepID=A0AAX4I5Y1_9PEZI|nr:hypothetical protein CDEST_03801 [Colletotrichum destructivum]